jgi:hypothetical protein
LGRQFGTFPIPLVFLPMARQGNSPSSPEIHRKMF